MENNLDITITHTLNEHFKKDIYTALILAEFVAYQKSIGIDEFKYQITYLEKKWGIPRMTRIKSVRKLLDDKILIIVRKNKSYTTYYKIDYDKISEICDKSRCVKIIN